MIPDEDDERKRVFLIIQDRFVQAGTTVDAFEESQGFGRGYLSRVVAGRRSSPKLLRKMADVLALETEVFPFGLTDDDFRPIQERLLERQLGKVVGEPYRDDVEVKSIPWKTMTPKKMKALVWEHPSSVLGVMCGVSDVAIGKYCRRFDIEKPPRGYWAKMGRYTPNPSGK